MFALATAFSAVFHLPSMPWREVETPAPSTVRLLCDGEGLRLCPNPENPQDSILPLFLGCESGGVPPSGVANSAVLSEWSKGHCRLNCFVPYEERDTSGGTRGRNLSIPLGDGWPHRLCQSGGCLKQSGINPGKYFAKENNLTCGVDYHGSCR